MDKSLIYEPFVITKLSATSVIYMKRRFPRGLHAFAAHDAGAAALGSAEQIRILRAEPSSNEDDTVRA
jgi:hypothetical protein